MDMAQLTIHMVDTATHTDHHRVSPMEDMVMVVMDMARERLSLATAMEVTVDMDPLQSMFPRLIMVMDMDIQPSTAMDTTLVVTTRERLMLSLVMDMEPEATLTDHHRDSPMEDMDTVVTAMEVMVMVMARDLLMLSQVMDMPQAMKPDPHRVSLMADMAMVVMDMEVMLDMDMARDLLMLSQVMDMDTLL